MASKGFEVRLTATVDSYVNAMNRARASTETMSKESAANLQKVGGQMRNVGGQMSRYLTLPLVGAAGAAIKMSSDFESAFAKMQGLAGVTASEVDDLKASVLDLAGRTAQAPQQLADALYQASSSGLDTAQAMAAVERAATASSAGMGRAADIVSLVASATASYGAANIDAARATDILTATIREGRADPEELAGTLGRVLPIAAKLGVSFEEVGGATAYLSNVFGDTNRTVTSMSGIMAKLVSPTKQGRDALTDMGTSVAELQGAIDENGLMGALDLLRSHGFEGNQQALRALFDDIDAFQGITALLGADQQDLAGIMDGTANSVGAADEAFKIMSETAGFKMKQAWADLQVALIQAGDVIMPIVTGIAGGVASLAETFADLPAPVQGIVLAFLALVAAAGPVLVVGGTLIRNFKEIRAAMTLMSASAGTASLALGAVGLVLFAATKIYMDNAEKKARLVKITNDFVDALNAERDGQKGAVDAQVKTLITNQDLIDKAHALGLETSDLAKIIKGESVPEWDALRDATKNATVGLDENGRVTGMTTYAQRGHAAAIKDVSDALGPMVEGFEDAIVQQQLEDKVTRELTVKFGEGTASMVEHGGAAGRLADSLGELPPIGDKVVLSEEEQEAALKTVTDALNSQVKALQDDLEAQQALIDFARRSADAQYALAASTDDYDRFLEELPGKLDDINKSKDSEAEKLRQTNALYRDGSTLAATLADDVVAAYDDATNGAITAKDKGDLWRTSMLNSAAAASGPARQSILDFAFAVNKVPAEKQVAITAAVEAGDIPTAIALLDGASETRKVEVEADVDDKKLGETKGKLDGLEDPLKAKVIVDADTSLASGKISLLMSLRRVGGEFKTSAAGRYVDHPMISTLGEGGLPEVVLPLTRPGRMAELMRDRRVSGPILGALGGTAASADGRVVNLTHTTIPAATRSVESAASAEVVSTAEAVSSIDDINAAQDELMERQFKRNAISYEDYRAYLDKRRAGLALYSDDEQAVYDRIEQLDESQARSREAEAKAREQDTKDQQDQADRVQKYLLDTNQISLADYMAYLGGRQNSYGTYTTEWFALTAQMAEVQRQIDQAAVDATRVVFDQADAVKALADANEANFTADTDYDAARAKVASTSADRNATNEDKQSAVDELSRAASAHASTAYNLREAQAANLGLRAGTREWASFMREQLSADVDYSRAIGRDNLANAIDRLLVGIPSFASGGYVPATPGGRLIRVGEAGQGEYMFPANKLHSMAGGGGTTVVNHYAIAFSGTVLDRAGVGRELRQILDEHDNRNGQNN